MAIFFLKPASSPSLVISRNSGAAGCSGSRNASLRCKIGKFRYLLFDEFGIEILAPLQVQTDADVGMLDSLIAFLWSAADITLPL